MPHKKVFYYNDIKISGCMLHVPCAYKKHLFSPRCILTQAHKVKAPVENVLPDRVQKWDMARGCI